jgi:hypothetical protein
MRICQSLLVIAFAATPLMASEPDVVRLSEPVEVGDNYEVFGAAQPDSADVLRLSELIENSDQYLGEEVAVETRIAKVCQKKGCFFVAQDGAATARITFRDYGFFIPTDSGGKTARLYGTFSRKPLSQEQADHYAEDAGEKPAPVTQSFEYSIVASGVKIFNS